MYSLSAFSNYAPSNFGNFDSVKQPVAEAVGNGFNSKTKTSVRNKYTV